MIEVNTRFVLHDGDLWMYHLSDRNGHSQFALADGEPMTDLGGGWWAADHEAAEVALSIPQPYRIVGYRLSKPDAESDRFPASLTPEEYCQRVDADEVYYSLYVRETEQVPNEITVVEGPWIRLDGAPPPADGRSWRANLPSELRHRPEYHHLFPGHMPGLRDHIEELARANPRVRHVLVDYQGRRGLDIGLEVPFDQPIYEYRPARNRDGGISRSRNGRNVAVTARRSLLLDVPQRVAGSNRAEAAAEWDRQVAEWTAAIDGASVKACSACRGHGHVIDGSEIYERKTP